jgi:hypothetical protein
MVLHTVRVFFSSSLCDLDENEKGDSIQQK